MKQTNDVGFAISHKENEHRRALLPGDIPQIRNKDRVFVETGYGADFGLTDDDYRRAGVNVAPRDRVLSCHIVCDPKIGDAGYLSDLRDQTVFGWVHAVQNRDIAQTLIDNCLTALVWEDMYEDGRHSFWRNNEIAGEAAVSHAYMCHGVFPYNTRVAVLGRGNTARGAVKTLNYMGADVTVYDRHTEGLFRKELPMYDVVVNAILWDTSRHDHIIYADDLRRMRPGSMIIDVSCDAHGAVETSVPTTIAEPTYMVDGVRHYVVDHTPALFYKTTSQSLSQVVARHLDTVIEGRYESDPVLAPALAVKDGVILDRRIIDFQGR